MYERDGLTMRAVERRDLEPLRLMHNHPSTLGVLTDTTFVTPAMQEKWFESLGGGGSRRYVVEDAEGLVAMVRIDGLDTRNGNACIGLDVMVERRGRGLGTRCFRLLLRYCFEELRLHMAWLLAAEFNNPARHMYEKLGFVQAGRLPQSLYRDGRYWDLLLMALTKSDWTEPG